jgi:hypothetical protein
VLRNDTFHLQRTRNLIQIVQFCPLFVIPVCTNNSNFGYRAIAFKVIYSFEKINYYQGRGIKRSRFVQEASLVRQHNPCLARIWPVMWDVIPNYFLPMTFKWALEDVIPMPPRDENVVEKRKKVMIERVDCIGTKNALHKETTLCFLPDPPIVTDGLVVRL